MNDSSSQNRGALGQRSNYNGPPAPEDIGMGTPASEGRMARGTRLASEAFAFLNKDRRLLLLPAAALLVDLICIGVAAVVVASTAGHHARYAVLAIASAVAIYPVTVATTFCNVALMHVVAQRWRGQQAGIRDGLSVARERFGAILAWSLIAATFGVVIQVLQRIGHLAWIERLLALVLNAAWAVATFFVVPALALENIGPVEAIKRSSSVVRRRWPESITGSIAIGGAAALAMIPGVILCVVGVTTFKSNPVSGSIEVAVGAAIALPVMLYSNATSAVFSLAVWNYAQAGESRGPFSVEDLESPFRGGAGIHKARRWVRTRVFRRGEG